MKRIRLALLTVCFVGLISTPGRTQFRTCTVACTHRVHQYDMGPCTHVCYGPFGPFACHQFDAYPCVHPVHQFDYVPC